MQAGSEQCRLVIEVMQDADFDVDAFERGFAGATRFPGGGIGRGAEPPFEGPHQVRT